MKKIGSLLLVCLMLFSGCARAPENSANRYSATYWDLFDTITELSGFASSQQEFDAAAEQFHQQMLRYHQLFDIYNSYDGINNLKTVNDQAGIAPVAVEVEIIELLTLCQEFAEGSQGAVDVTMGAVLRLWHDARTDGSYVPEMADLETALEHTGFDKLVIDRENSTVFLTDPNASLDVGAIAKGYATGKVCEQLPAGYLASVGGNIYATGPKPSGDWVVGIQSPEGDGYVRTVSLNKGAVVTSGDYQRYYTLDGVRYCHIIDKNTLYPANRWKSVTVYCEDSGLADCLSTALFVLSLEDGQALLDHYGAEAMWIAQGGTYSYSPNFEPEA